MQTARYTINEEEYDGTFWTLKVGDFSVPETDVAFETSFTRSDAVVLANLLVGFSGGPESIVIALYPWARKAWARLSSTGWTSLARKDFVRRWKFGFRSKVPWEAGFAHSLDELVRIVEWAWTLPGRDTLLFLVSPEHDIAPLLNLFEDDREDDGSNEARLASAYEAVFSRGKEASGIRVVIRDADLTRLHQALESTTRVPARGPSGDL